MSAEEPVRGGAGEGVREPMRESVRKPADLRAAFEASTGFWPDMLDGVVEGDPELFEMFERYASVPYRRGALAPQVREFIGLAVNASTTHLFEPAIRAHIKNALALGASRDELIEVLELASAVGIHTATIAMPLLRRELEDHGQPTGGELSEHQHEVKNAFTEGRQSWTELLEDFLRLDADWLEAYVAYSTVSWKRGALSPKVKELIYTAIDCQTTHLYAPGTRFHIRNALNQGASRDEILEVLELVSVIGIHTLVMAMPILAEELSAADLD
jgi:alkylhydroperoxidase/carboxymuconolactone decarboxylase family protein YurZ